MNTRLAARIVSVTWKEGEYRPDACRATNSKQIEIC